MKIWGLLKYFFLREYEKESIRNAVGIRFALFDLFYFLKYKEEPPQKEQIIIHSNIIINFHYKKEVYDILSMLIYVVLSVICNIIIEVINKNPPAYWYYIFGILSFIISLLIKVALIHRNRIKFSVSLLLDSLITLIILLGAKPDNLIVMMSQIKDGHVSSVRE